MIENFSLNLRDKYIKYFTSNFIYIIVPFFTLPLISRIYSPKDLASYSIILGAAIIISRFSTLGLHNIILIDKNKEEKNILLLLPILTSVIINFILFLILLNININSILEINEIEKYLYVIPIVSLLYSIYLVFKLSLIRFGDLIYIAKSRLLFSLTLPILTLFLGLLNFNIAGLFISICVTNLLSIIYLFKHTKRYLLKNINLSEISFYLKFYFKKYSSFIMWSNPSTLMNFFSNYILVILLTRFYGIGVTGAFVFASKFLEIPISIVTSPLQDIFTQNATEEIDRNGNANLSFKQTFIVLLLISIIFIIPTSLYFSRYIPFLFGNEWKDSVEIMRALCFIVSIRFISSPLSIIWIIRKKEKLNFIWQFLLVFLVCSSTIIPFYYSGTISIVNLLSIYSCWVGLWYLLSIFISYKISNTRLNH